MIITSGAHPILDPVGSPVPKSLAYPLIFSNVKTMDEYLHQLNHK
mgnify:CR=1 FL=1